MDKIFIRGLRARGVIGVYDWEREKPQEIVMDVTLFADLEAAGESDDLGQSIDYSALAERLLAHAETAERLTVEALARDLARICLEAPGVVKAVVRVEKPAAVPFAQSVGVEIERVAGSFPKNAEV
jgi:FolB domain-containing protein